MRPSIAITSLVAAIAMSQGAEAGIFGLIADIGVDGAKAAIVAAARNATKAIGNAITKSISKLPDPVRSGLTSGWTSGTISSSAGIGIGLGVDAKHSKRDSTKMRRTLRSQKLYERELLMSHPEIRDNHDPGHAPAGINQSDWDRCYLDVTHAHVVMKDHVDSGNTVEIDGIPPSCMSLSLSAASNPAGYVPKTCGHACLRWENLTGEEYATLKEIFEPAQNK